MTHPATRYITKLDSTTSLLRALANFLRGRGFPGIGVAPRMPASVAETVNLLPAPIRFTSNCCASGLEQYLGAGAGFDEMYLMLFSNGIEGIGMATLDRWRRILGQARLSGQFVGVDEREFPRDYASFVRYHTELKRRVHARQPLPKPLTVEELDCFLSGVGGRYAVRIVDET